jgi:hypothetical protein
MSQPPEVPQSPGANELREVIEDCLGSMSISEEDLNNVLLFFLSEGAPLFSGQTTYFILGSYEKYQMRRLRLVENQLNRRPFAYSFLLCDLLDSGDLKQDPQAAPSEKVPWTHVKFHLLMRYIDFSILVLEGRHAGPSVELGEIMSQTSYFEKTYVFSRSYDSLSQEDIEVESETINVSNPYSQVQLDKFKQFDQAGRLKRWKHRSDLVYQLTTVP